MQMMWGAGTECAVGVSNGLVLFNTLNKTNGMFKRPKRLQHYVFPCDYGYVVYIIYDTIEDMHFLSVAIAILQCV